MDAASSANWTALNQAPFQGNYKAVRTLLVSDADIDAKAM